MEGWFAAAFNYGTKGPVAQKASHSPFIYLTSTMNALRLKTLGSFSVLIISLLFAGAHTVHAQQGTFSYTDTSYTLNSGPHSSAAGAEETQTTFRQTVRIVDANWLQVRFGDFDLGERSTLVITSLEDNATQTLDHEALSQADGQSAFFNGEAIELELRVAPGESGVFFDISGLNVGDGSSKFRKETLCDGDDDRASSSDAAVGRLVNCGGGSCSVCTGWIISNGWHLAAGHCNYGGQLQFNVPQSTSSGAIVFPPPEDQYPVDGGSVTSVDNGVGDDWGVFAVNDNSDTGLQPVEAQNAFYRVSRDHGPSTLRVTGYGADDGTDNFTLQTDTGPSEGETVQSADDVFWQYRVDTEGGNSGGPVRLTSSRLGVAIHTNGGCTDSGGSNSGTSFENDDLENAMNTSPGTNVEYVDLSHPVGSEDGTVVRPYNTYGEGVTSLTAGGILSIVEGRYTGTRTISKAMLIQAPVGSVILGD